MGSCADYYFKIDLDESQLLITNLLVKYQFFLKLTDKQLNDKLRCHKYLQIY